MKRYVIARRPRNQQNEVSGAMAMTRRTFDELDPANLRALALSVTDYPQADYAVWDTVEHVYRAIFPASLAHAALVKGLAIATGARTCDPIPVTMPDNRLDIRRKLPM